MTGYRLAELIAGYLVACGWHEDEPGRWRRPGVRPATKRTPVTLMTTLTAAEWQIGTEYYAARREERERLGLADVIGREATR